MTTPLRHQVSLPELKGLVVEREDGRLETYGDVPDDWRTSEQQVGIT